MSKRRHPHHRVGRTGNAFSSWSSTFAIVHFGSCVALPTSPGGRSKRTSFSGSCHVADFVGVHHKAVVKLACAPAWLLESAANTSPGAGAVLAGVELITTGVLDRRRFGAAARDGDLVDFVFDSDVPLRFDMDSHTISVSPVDDFSLLAIVQTQRFRFGIFACISFP